MSATYILKILDIFKGLYNKFGVNYEKLRLILKVKLIMDSRRGSNLTSNQGEDKPQKNQFHASLLAYFIVGAFSTPIIAMNINPMVKMTLYFSFFMVMMITVLISDFSTVILDTEDKEIIGTKGVDSKTLNASKVTHIFIYIVCLSIAVSGLPLLASVRYGIKFFGMLLLSIIMIDIFMIMLTACIYFVILKLFKGEKLKDMLNMFQIVFILLFTLGAQLVGRAFSFINFDYIYNEQLWNLLMPPMWFASNFSDDSASYLILALRVLSIIIPIVSLVVYIKLIPVFENRLQKLNDNSFVAKSKKKTISQRLSKLICKNNEERILFDFISNVLKKDREFKTRVYPTLALGAFMPFLIIFTSVDTSNFVESILELRNTEFYLIMYMFIMMTQMILNLVQYSNEYEASWIYEVVPIKDERNVHSASIKAIMYRLFTPIFIVISICFVAFFGVNVIVSLFIMYVSSILIFLQSFKMSEKEYPFSNEYSVSNAGSNMITALKSLLIVGVLAGLHYLSLSNIFITIGYLVIITILTKLIWNKTFNK